MTLEAASSAADWKREEERMDVGRSMNKGGEILLHLNHLNHCQLKSCAVGAVSCGGVFRTCGTEE